jgi:hypothetical protein
MYWEVIPHRIDDDDDDDDDDGLGSGVLCCGLVIAGSSQPQIVQLVSSSSGFTPQAGQAGRIRDMSSSWDVSSGDADA